MRITAASPEHKNARVFFEGHEISSICIWADDEKGQAGILLLDMERKIILGPDKEPICVVLNGQVEIKQETRWQ